VNVFPAIAAKINRLARSKGSGRQMAQPVSKMTAMRVTGKKRAIRNAHYQTPSTAYGPDFVLGVKGVVRDD